MKKLVFPRGKTLTVLYMLQTDSSCKRLHRVSLAHRETQIIPGMVHAEFSREFEQLVPGRPDTIFSSSLNRDKNHFQESTGKDSPNRGFQRWVQVTCAINVLAFEGQLWDLHR